MADEEEIVVSVDGDDKGEAEVVIGQEDVVAELKKQYEALEADNKRRKEREEAALRRSAEDRAAAENARKDAAAARAQTSASQADSIDAGLAAAQAEASQAEADYASLMEKGDYAGAAKAQRRIASAESKIGRLEDAKASIEAQKSVEPILADTHDRTADPFEAHVSKFTHRTAQWMRDHRDWVVDSRKSAKLQGAHHMAVGDGLTPDTDEYFEHVEKTLGLREAQTNGADNRQPARQVRASSPPVAPVNGGGGGHSSGASERRGNEVRLTAGEAKAANDGITHVWGEHDLRAGRIKDKSMIGKAIGNQEFARRKLDMQKRGLYDRSYTE